MQVAWCQPADVTAQGGAATPAQAMPSYLCQPVHDGTWLVVGLRGGDGAAAAVRREGAPPACAPGLPWQAGREAGKPLRAAASHLIRVIVVSVVRVAAEEAGGRVVNRGADSVCWRQLSPHPPAGQQ